MTTREILARELMRLCPADLRSEHEEIADAILADTPWDTVLDTAESLDLDATYAWLHRMIEAYEYMAISPSDVEVFA